MLLPNQFNSLFELFAAFNFAYVISDQFNEDLQKKLIRGFDGVYQGMEGIRGKFKTCEDTLPTINIIKDQKLSNEDLIEQARITFNSLKDEFEVINCGIDERISNVSKSFNFQYVCMFLGFYCVGYLLISSFFSETGPLNGLLAESIVVLNLIVTVFVVYALSKDKLRPWSSGKTPEKVLKINRKARIGYAFTVSCLLGTALITIVFYILAKFKLSVHCKYETLQGFVIFWSLLLATFHFILYAVRAYRNSSNVAPELMKIVIDFENKYQEFYRSKVDSLITTEETLKKMIVNP